MAVYYADLPPGSPRALAREVLRLQNASLSIARTPDPDPHGIRVNRRPATRRLRRLARTQFPRLLKMPCAPCTTSSWVVSGRRRCHIIRCGMSAAAFRDWRCQALEEANM